MSEEINIIGPIYSSIESRAKQEIKGLKGKNSVPGGNQEGDAVVGLKEKEGYGKRVWQIMSPITIEGGGDTFAAPNFWTRVVVPEKYKHPELKGDANELGDASFTSQRLLSGSDFGIKLVLFSLVGFGIKRQESADPSDPKQAKTYWGEGPRDDRNNAFFGQVIAGSTGLVYNVELRTLPLPLWTGKGNGVLQLFYSYNWGENFYIRYKSGYHRYRGYDGHLSSHPGEPVADNPELVDDFKIAEGQIIGHRFGPKLRLDMDGVKFIYVNISLFGEINTINLKGTEKGKDFDFSVTNPFFRLGLGLELGFDPFKMKVK